MKSVLFFRNSVLFFPQIQCLPFYFSVCCVLWSNTILSSKNASKSMNS
uniref:Uncharacterized protein n=1 Tax=Anguilla anguilla TaxID=7936 RepID=A0A0E9QZS4_ANGAN